MRLVFALFLLILAQVFDAETIAQTQAPACPSITIRNQDGFRIREATIYSGDEVTLMADIAGLAPEDKPTFNWAVSPGTIVSGQGTATVTVSTDADVGSEVTVTVEVGSVSALSPQCDRRASEKIRVYEYFCPTISISCPMVITELGKPVNISATIPGGGAEILKYKWQVSAGKIISGQGTLEIIVDTSELAGQNITATLEVDGFRPGCDRTESCSLIPYEPLPQARKFDEYNEVSWINEERRLSNFGVQLQEELGAQGYIIVYGTRRVKQHLARSQKFIVKKYGIDPQRISQINGGSRKRMTVELWIVPVGAAPPKPTPNF